MIQNPVTASLNGLQPQGYFSSLLSLLINIMFVFATIFFFFRLVMGGINWINSAGDKGKLEQSRGQVVNAVIGLVIVFSTYVIVNLISSIFNVNLTSFDFSSMRLQ